MKLGDMTVCDFCDFNTIDLVARRFWESRFEGGKVFDEFERLVS